MDDFERARATRMTMRLRAALFSILYAADFAHDKREFMRKGRNIWGLD